MFTFFRSRAQQAPATPTVARPPAGAAPVDERIAQLQREVEELER
jgi:hypothetical protein